MPENPTVFLRKLAISEDAEVSQYIARNLCMFIRLFKPVED